MTNESPLTQEEWEALRMAVDCFGNHPCDYTSAAKWDLAARTLDRLKPKPALGELVERWLREPSHTLLRLDVWHALPEAGAYVHSNGMRLSRASGHDARRTAGILID